MDQQLPQISGQSAQIAPSSGGGLLDFITGPAEKLIASLGSDVSQAGSQVLKGITEDPQDVSENAPELESAGNALGAIPELGTAVDVAEDVPKLAEGAGKDIEDLVSGGKAADKAMPAISAKTAAEIKAEKTAQTPLKTNTGEATINSKVQYATDNGASEPINPNGEKFGSSQELPPVNSIPKSKIPPPPNGKPPMITDKQADPLDRAAYLSMFQVPRPVAEKMNIPQQKVIDQLIDDGITGVKNIDQLKNTGESITGRDGGLTQINRHIVGKVKTPMNYSSVSDFIKNDVPDRLDGELGSVKGEVGRAINFALKPLNYEKSGEVPSNMPENKAWGADLFKSSQNLYDQIKQFSRRGHDTWGNETNSAYVRAADTLTALKSKVDGVLHENTKDIYEQSKNDPEVQAQLQKMPKGVANRFMQGATSLRDSQKQQAPYASLLKDMIPPTEDSETSAFTKALKASQQTPNSAKVEAAVEKHTPLPGIGKTVMGKALGAMAKPFDKTTEDFNVENTTPKGRSTNNGIPKTGQKGKVLSALAALGVGGGAYLLGKSGESQTNAQGNSNAYNPQQQHAQSVSQNPSNVNTSVSAGDLAQGKGVTLDSNGLVGNVPPPWQTLGSDGKSISVNGQAAKDQMQQLTTQYEAQLKAGDPNAKVTQGQIQNLQTSIQAGQKFEQGWQGNQEVDNLIKKAIPLISKSNLNALNMLSFGQIGVVGVNEAMNSNFGTLYGILQQIQKMSPYAGNLLDSKNLVNGDTLKNALVGVNNTQWNQYRLSMQQFAGNTQGANGQVSANMIPATQQVPSGGNSPMPSIPANFKGFAGSVSQSGN
jgi:hypothetical protein